MIMDSQRLHRDPLEPSTDGARRMLMMLSHIGLRAATIEQFEGASNILRMLLEIGHRRVMPFTEIGVTGLADPLANTLLTVLAI